MRLRLKLSVATYERSPNRSTQARAQVVAVLDHYPNWQVASPHIPLLQSHKLNSSLDFEQSTKWADIGQMGASIRLLLHARHARRYDLNFQMLAAVFTVKAYQPLSIINSDKSEFYLVGEVSGPSDQEELVGSDGGSFRGPRGDSQVSTTVITFAKH